MISFKAFHAVDSCNLKEGQWLAVIGAGGLGQLATQYGKAMGYKVLAIDINDATLDVCKSQGADQVYNSKSNANYVDEIKKLTNGGVHAAAVFSNASAAYASAPSVLRVNGTMMIVGIPHQPIQVSTLDMTLGRYKIRSESTSIPQRMGKAIEFTAKHGIQPEVEIREKGLEDLDNMVHEMMEGRSTKRMAVVF